jgi:serine/threonine protein kinase
MEYIEVDYLSLFLKLQTQPFTEEQVLDIFRQLVSPLFYLHSHNIIHRDIKPENIFLTTKYTVKIGEFGLSYIVDYNLSKSNICWN